MAFATRKIMTETERRYSEIEKECLVLVFGCTRFDHYLHSLDVITDHKPLETVLAKSINSAPKRSQRMMLRLQKYLFNVVH